MGKFDQYRLGLRINVDDANGQEEIARSTIKEVSLDPNEMLATVEISETGNYLRWAESFRYAGTTYFCHSGVQPRIVSGDNERIMPAP